MQVDQDTVGCALCNSNVLDGVTADHLRQHRHCTAVIESHWSGLSYQQKCRRLLSGVRGYLSGMAFDILCAPSLGEQRLDVETASAYLGLASAEVLSSSGVLPPGFLRSLEHLEHLLCKMDRLRCWPSLIVPLVQDAGVSALHYVSCHPDLSVQFAMRLLHADRRVRQWQYFPQLDPPLDPDNLSMWPENDYFFPRCAS